MRAGNGTTNPNLKWLTGDHPSTYSGQALGSTPVVANLDGTLLSRTLYKPLHCFQGRLWGEVRYQSGALPTDYTFTGQYAHTGDFGLMYYVARWYDPALGRFAQADTLVPGAGNPMAWDRYAYALNNSLRYSDPSGHWFETALDIASLAYDVWDISQNGLNWENGLALAADVASVALPLVTGGGALVRAATHADDAIDALKYADEAASGLSHTLQDAIAATAKDTDTIIAVRSRPAGASALDGIYPAKPPRVDTIVISDDGLRYSPSTNQRYVSDLDIAYANQNGNLLPDHELDPVIDGINQSYGYKVVTHGAQVNYPGRLDTWDEIIYVFGPQGFIDARPFVQRFQYGEGLLK